MNGLKLEKKKSNVSNMKCSMTCIFIFLEDPHLKANKANCDVMHSDSTDIRQLCIFLLVSGL